MKDFHDPGETAKIQAPSRKEQKGKQARHGEKCKDGLLGQFPAPSQQDNQRNKRNKGVSQDQRVAFQEETETGKAVQNAGRYDQTPMRAFFDGLAPALVDQ